MAESSNRFIAWDKPIKSYIPEHKNKKTRTKTCAEKVLKMATMREHYRRQKSFSHPNKGKSGSSKQTTYKRTMQGKQVQPSWSVDWWRGKHGLQKIFTIGFWRSDKMLALRRNDYLLCQMNAILYIYLLCCRKLVEVAGHLELQVGKMIFKLSVKYTWNWQQQHLWQIHPGGC